MIRIATERFHEPIDQTKTARWYKDRHDKIEGYLADADFIWSGFVVSIGGENVPEDLRVAWSKARAYAVEMIAELDRLLLPEEPE